MFRLEQGDSVIYLPNPQFNETQKLSHKVITKRTASGSLHTTIRKNTSKDIFTWRFLLTSSKKTQFVEWVSKYGSELITVVSDLWSIRGYIRQDQSLRSVKRSYADSSNPAEWELTLEISQNG